MNPLRKLLFTAAVAFCSCGAGTAEGIDPVTGEGVEIVRQHLIADDLYSKLRQAEDQMLQPPPQTIVEVGTLSASGQFTGLMTTYSVDPRTHKPIPMAATTSIDGIDAVLHFSIPVGQSATLTANGQTVFGSGPNISINVGHATTADWSLTVGATTRADKLFISRAGVIGAGAFTLAAMPISIVYEPPMNAAHTNSATIGFRQEMTTITTVSSSQSSSSTPKWATGVVLSSMLDRLSKHVAVAAGVKNLLSAGKTLMGSVESTATSGTTVNSDSTLGISQVSASSVTTNARLGPGHGDIIAFYKDARVAWAMEAGEVKLAVIDHGPLAMVTVDTLKNDLAAVKAGAAAPVTGLDALSLESLIGLDPLASTSSRVIAAGGLFNNGVKLAAPRFRKDTTLILNGTSFNNSISHTVTQTDRTATLSTKTVVKNYHPGWLSLVGIGVTQAGTTSTTVSMGTSRSDSVSSTVSASFNLSAAANENYSVEVDYDNIFGGFLTRLPPAPLVVFGQLSTIP